MSAQPSEAAALERFAGIMALKPEGQEPVDEAIEAVAEPSAPSSPETDEPEAIVTPGEEVVESAQVDLDEKLEGKESMFANLLGPEPDEDDPDNEDLDLDAPDDAPEEPDEPDDAPVEPSGEWEDPEVTKLKRRLAKAEKEAEKQKQLRVQSSAKDWKAEAKRRFPLADVDQIQAESKRAFLRAAQKSHNEIRKVVAPHLLAAEKQIEETLRKKFEDAWGKPMEGPGSVPVAAAAHQQELEAARATGDLTKVVGVLRKLSGRG